MARRKLLVVGIFVCGIVFGVRNFSVQDASRLADVFLPASSPAPVSEDWQVVKRVVDGDTIELESGEKVRYIGINAPESVKPNSPVECFGHEASAYDKQLVGGKRVRLEKDVSDRDKYGRLLRFVYLEDGTLVNDTLVRDGYAYASTFPPDVSRVNEFKQAQQEARNAERGLWSSSTCGGKK
jgi:micrococcal nuclease